jgi:hypothetical protein
MLVVYFPYSTSLRRGESSSEVSVKFWVISQEAALFMATDPTELL